MALRQVLSPDVFASREYHKVKCKTKGKNEHKVPRFQNFKDYLNANVEDCGGKDVVDCYMKRIDDFLEREVMVVN